MFSGEEIGHYLNHLEWSASSSSRAAKACPRWLS
jgi:hypothetical protein